MNNVTPFDLTISWAQLKCIDPNSDVILTLKYSPDFDPEETKSVFDVKINPIYIPLLIPRTNYHLSLIQEEGPDIELPNTIIFKTQQVDCELT